MRAAFALFLAGVLAAGIFFSVRAAYREDEREARWEAEHHCRRNGRIVEDITIWPIALSDGNMTLIPVYDTKHQYVCDGGVEFWR